MTRDGIIKHWSVTSGRVLIGTVDLSEDGAFVARDRDGRIVGAFDSLLQASRVFELVEDER
jgi:hypothetical protein